MDTPTFLIKRDELERRMTAHRVNTSNALTQGSWMARFAPAALLFAGRSLGFFAKRNTWISALSIPFGLLVEGWLLPRKKNTSLLATVLGLLNKI